MHRQRSGWFLVGLASFTAAVISQSAFAFDHNSLVLNEFNGVSGTKFLANGSAADSGFGTVQGNGQNWLEFLVVQGDPKAGGGYKNTLDLRGWTINWSFDKDNAHFNNQPPSALSYGSGAIQFSQDPLWAAVPRGTMITMSEWSDAWYNSSAHTRTGGYNGLGILHGAIKGSNDVWLGATSTLDADPHLLATNTYWNPAANGGGASGDWNIHFFAGDTPSGPQGQFKYFNFTGSVTSGSVTSPIGTDTGGLFTANNDNWQFTIRDAQSSVIQGPIGEQDCLDENGAPLGSGERLSSTEVWRLENFDAGANPTQSTYLGASIFDYKDGSESTFGSPNVWSQGGFHQGLTGLRDWLVMGDADLDGAVTGADYVIWRKHLNSSGGWRDGDFSGNGTVDMADYAIWRANFGVASPGNVAGLLTNTSVPEPHTFTLLALASLVLASRASRTKSKIAHRGAEIAEKRNANLR